MKKAVIFDMDGVISDTQVLHSHTESEVLQEYGIQMHPDEITRRFAGVADHEAFPKIFREAKKELHDLGEFVSKKWGKMFAKPEAVVAVPGALEIISELGRRKIPMAVASGASLTFIEHVLKILDIRDSFAAVTSSDEVASGKPAPDVFLLAAKRIGVDPSDCVVIEDGLSGMQAAKAAGMKCVALLTHVHEEESPAEIKVKSLTELTVDVLLR